MGTIVYGLGKSKMHISLGLILEKRSAKGGTKCGL